MATRNAKIDGPTNDGVFVASWTGLLNGDTGVGIGMGKFPDKTVQAVGPFGTAGAVTIEGSNDGGTTWGVLHDPQGVDISIGDTQPIVIAESPLLMRPDVTAGDGATNIKVYIVGVARGV